MVNPLVDDALPTDEGPLLKGASPIRTCIVTRKAVDPSKLLRFALSPDGVVTPDLARKLPGRGAWIINDRLILREAIKKNAFTRAFKQQVKIPPDLEGLILALMRKAVIDNLSIAIKAGLAVFGFDNVQKAIAKQSVAVLIAAEGASPDQLSKLIAGSGLILSEINQIVNERLQFLQGRVKETRAASFLWVRSLTGDELDKMTGRSGLTYIALKNGQGLTPFLTRMTDLARFSMEKSGKPTDNA